MPVSEQEVLSPGRMLLRHIAPKAAAENTPGIFAPLGQGFTVLGQTLFAEPLPVSHLPSSPDFHEGHYTLRLGDAGDFTASFPNKDSSAGKPWRSRFSTNGHTEFMEISREGEIETIGVITKIIKDRQKITLEGYDGFFLLKKAYEQDYTAVIAPRDLIERSTMVNVMLTGTEFPGPGPGLPAGWTNISTAFGKAEVFPTGGLLLTCPAGHVGTFAGIEATTTIPTTSSIFSIKIGLTLSTNLESGHHVGFSALNAGGSYELRVENSVAKGLIAQITRVQGAERVGATLPLLVNSTAFLAGSQHTLYMETDGQWVRGFIDGTLIGFAPMGLEPKPLTLTTGITTPNATELKATVQSIIVKTRQPFLMRGTDKGDYVLPGTANTYPTGGLHGRYIVNGATSSTEKWWETILAPDPRRSGFPTYIEDQQPGLTGTTQPNGVPATYWAARWFGAVYLPLSKGNVKLKVTLGTQTGVRVKIGTAELKAWEPAAARTLTLEINAASFGGKDGWYPIIIEFFRTEPNTEGTIGFHMVPAANYTDPGGTALTSGVEVLVPATSLSPLGCVDARIQGSSLFDIVQETAKNFGYQLTCEPKQLESGEFPGQVVPRGRVGRDTDEIIEPDDIDRKSGIDNYTLTLDATDAASSVKAFGSGIADGKGSQVAFEAISLPDETADLFDMQAWVSAGDIAFPTLLAARANAELSLRRGSWENIGGDPIARDRLADTFPLTGTLAQFRWRPGDGVRLLLPDVELLDTTPRAMLQITRSFGPEGRMQTNVGFRSRPKDPLYAHRVALKEATRGARAYQKQYATRSSGFVEQEVAPGAFTVSSQIQLGPEERIVSAVVAIGANTTAQKVGIEINATLRTGELGGPWTTPVSSNVLAFAVPKSVLTNRVILVRVKNEDALATVVNWQLIVTLLV